MAGGFSVLPPQTAQGMLCATLLKNCLSRSLMRLVIESHSAGSVLVDGGVWQARSKEPIPAGSTVRVLRQDGFWLTVKKVEQLTKR